VYSRVIEIEKATGIQFFGEIQKENPIDGVNMRTSLSSYGDFATWINALCSNPNDIEEKTRCEIDAENGFITCNHDCNSDQICITQCVRDYFLELDGCPCGQRCPGKIMTNNL